MNHIIWLLYQLLLQMNHAFLTIISTVITDESYYRWMMIIDMMIITDESYYLILYQLLLQMNHIIWLLYQLLLQMNHITDEWWLLIWWLLQMKYIIWLFILTVIDIYIYRYDTHFGNWECKKEGGFCHIHVGHNPPKRCRCGKFLNFSLHSMIVC